MFHTWLLDVNRSLSQEWCVHINEKSFYTTLQTTIFNNFHIKITLQLTSIFCLYNLKHFKKQQFISTGLMHNRSFLKRGNSCVMWNTFYYYSEIQQEELVFSQTLFFQNNKLSNQSILPKPHLTFFYKAWYVGLLTWIYKMASYHLNRRKKKGCNLIKGNSVPNSGFHLQKNGTFLRCLLHFWGTTQEPVLYLTQLQSFISFQGCNQEVKLFSSGYMLQMYHYNPNRILTPYPSFPPVVLTLLLTSQKAWK